MNTNNSTNISSSPSSSLPPPSTYSATTLIEAPHSNLSEEDLIVCSFGPEYYRGVVWGSFISLICVVTMARRAHLRGKQMLDRLAKDTQAQNRAQTVSEHLDKHNPGSAAARAKFTQEQRAANKKMANVAPLQWALVRVCAMTGLLKIGKLYMASRRYSDFLYDHEQAEQIADSILLKAEEKAAKQGEPLTAEESKLLDDAMRVKAMADFRRVVQLEKQLKRAEELSENGGVASGPESDFEFRTGHKQGMRSQAAHGGKAGPQVFPTFWDGFAVGVFGSLVDADVPSKPTSAFLYMRAGH